MNLNFRYRKTPSLQSDLQNIEVNCRLISLLPQQPERELNLRRESLLKSSLFSAKIEGNQLSFNDVRTLEKSPRSRQKQEILNLHRAYSWINQQSHLEINGSLIKKLHHLSLIGLDSEAGEYRRQQSAIFNVAGVAIYLPPPPAQVNSLIQQLLPLSHSNRDHPIITAAIFQYSFEKIHPFIDGNGRVGRLLSTIILKNNHYDFRGLLSVEETIHQRREQYYDALNQTKRDITLFVEFFASVVFIQSQQVVKQLSLRKTTKPEDSLLPRRKEILLIIREHQTVSFNFLHRRFLSVPKSSLYFDLKQLARKGFIIKIGSTRGALYQASNQ